MALVIHCVRQASGEEVSEDVDEASVASGVAIARWFGCEAHRVYSMMAEGPEDSRYRKLVELIERKDGLISPRELMRSDQRAYRTAKVARAALEELIKAGLGKWESETGHGRPSLRFRLNDNTDE